MKMGHKRELFCSRGGKMLLTVYTALLLWRIDCVVESTKGNITYIQCSEHVTRFISNRREVITAAPIWKSIGFAVRKSNNQSSGWCFLHFISILQVKVEGKIIGFRSVTALFFAAKMLQIDFGRLMDLLISSECFINTGFIRS